MYPCLPLIHNSAVSGIQNTVHSYDDYRNWITEVISTFVQGILISEAVSVLPDCSWYTTYYYYTIRHRKIKSPMFLSALMATFYGVRVFTDSPECLSKSSEHDYNITHWFEAAFKGCFSANASSFAYYAFFSPFIRKHYI